MIDIREYIISNETLPNESGFIFKLENSYIIEKGSNTLLKVKEYSRGIIRCENGICYCIFSSDEMQNNAYINSNRKILSINNLQKAKYYKRKKFFENFE